MYCHNNFEGLFKWVWLRNKKTEPGASFVGTTFIPSYATEENMDSLSGKVEEKNTAEMGSVLRKRHL